MVEAAPGANRNLRSTGANTWLLGTPSAVELKLLLLVLVTTVVLAYLVSGTCCTVRVLLHLHLHSNSMIGDHGCKPGVGPTWCTPFPNLVVKAPIL